MREITLTIEISGKPLDTVKIQLEEGTADSFRKQVEYYQNWLREKYFREIYLGGNAVVMYIGGVMSKSNSLTERQLNEKITRRQVLHIITKKFPEWYTDQSVAV